MKLKTVLSDCDFRSWDRHQRSSGWRRPFVVWLTEEEPKQWRYSQRKRLINASHSALIRVEQAETAPSVSITDKIQISLELTALYFAVSR